MWELAGVGSPENLPGPESRRFHEMTVVSHFLWRNLWQCPSSYTSSLSFTRPGQQKVVQSPSESGRQTVTFFWRVTILWGRARGVVKQWCPWQSQWRVTLRFNWFCNCCLRRKNTNRRLCLGRRFLTQVLCTLWIDSSHWRVTVSLRQRRAK